MTSTVQASRPRRTSTSGWARGTPATGGSEATPRRVGRLGGVRGDWHRAAAPRRRRRTRTSSAPTTTAGSSGCRSASSTPETRQWSIYWADSRRPGMLDPPVIGAFAGDVGPVRGRGRLQRAADPRPVHLVARDDAERHGGSRRSPTTAGGRGRRTGSRTSRAWRTTLSVLELHAACGRLRARDEARRARRRASRSATRSSSGTTSRPRTSPSPRRSRTSHDSGSPTRRASASSGSASSLGFVILHRCGDGFHFLLVSHVAERQRALGDGLGEGRRRRPASSTRGRSTARTARRSASGSSAPSARAARLEPVPPLAARPGRAARRTCATPSRGRCEARLTGPRPATCVA